MAGCGGGEEEARGAEWAESVYEAGYVERSLVSCHCKGIGGIARVSRKQMQRIVGLWKVCRSNAKTILSHTIINDRQPGDKINSISTTKDNISPYIKADLLKL